MTQWGSKTLGDQGKTAIEIIRYFYGENMFINSANEIAGVPSSWPGRNLTVGSSGEKVSQIQSQLNAISNSFTVIPKVAVDGQFGEKTKTAVETFQRIFNLPVNGIIDFTTWYKISHIYTGVTRIAELV